MDTPYGSAEMDGIGIGGQIQKIISGMRKRLVIQ
jgi:hypothetical protein